MGRLQHLQAVELLRVAAHPGETGFLAAGRDMEVRPWIMEKLRRE